LRHKILDIPNERSSHLAPTPRGGGLAIVLSWYLGITILFFWGQIEKSLFLALLSGVILAVISLVDDIVTVKPLIRLFFQMVTAIIAVSLLNGLNPVIIGEIKITSHVILFPLAVIGILWFVNLYNFLDGTDGYASVEAIAIAIAMMIITGNSVNILLIASVSGFLFWNWPKARIFMGDIGSTQLGFILVILGIYFHNKLELSIIHWIMLSSLFWFDATVTLFRRLLNKERISVAHRKHAYQRAVQSGLSHQNLIFCSIVINTIITIFVIFSHISESPLIPLFLLNMVFLFVLILVIDKRVPFTKS
jgi:UDP-N-acetylmuramyl pentapeptide phosphotransferase/UDP-N-acetylglucosamine-1-phosphate transferase